MARGHLSIDCRSVSAILTNVTHKEAARSQRRDERTPQSWNYLVPRQWYTKGTKGGCVLPCQRGSSRKLICVHTLPSLRTAQATRGDTSPSTAFTLQNHIIHLFTHLSILSLAGIVWLIELPETCAACYRVRRSRLRMIRWINSLREVEGWRLVRLGPMGSWKMKEIGWRMDSVVCFEDWEKERDFVDW